MPSVFLEGEIGKKILLEKSAITYVRAYEIPPTPRSKKEKNQ